ncbi:ATP-binding protein [Capillimicrobium parvum]|uniref:histidine kinase n=1 Tax=Capillimicrobium parvum TaxID=2884022 RepID=A0A9E6XZM5_9ACTN|nr:ATP-binding protein [Capillimicrobium parvum]UGS36983.1 Sensor-type histidine kinase PrrB [Capillimicrobium parvum]
MRRRLVLSTALIAVAAVLLLGVPLGVVGTQLLRQSANQRLEREADRAATRLAAERAAGRRIDAALLAEVAAPGHRLEVTLRNGRVVSGGDRIDDGGFRVPADGNAGFRRVVAVAPGDESTERVGTVWLAVGLLSLLAVVAAVVLALVQARRLARPFERLAGRAAGVGHPGFATEHEISGVPEVDAVEQALTSADARIADLLRAEREFSANASHQLRSPLTGLRLRLEEINVLADDGPIAQEAAAAQGQADRLMDTIEHLEAVGRRREAAGAGPVADLAGIVDEQARAVWRPRFDAARRALVVHVPDEAPVGLAPEAIRQIADVLLDNALAHGDGATSVSVTTGPSWSRLAVEDEGSGVADADRDLVFLRGHSAAGGSGVGLALARDLVRRGGGELSVRHGSRFEAVLPAP